MAYFNFNDPITSDICLIARYKKKVFTFNIQQPANGSISVRYKGEIKTSSFNVEWGDVVTILEKGSPAEGYEYTSVTLDNEPVVNTPVDVVVKSNMVYKAITTIKSCTVAINQTSNQRIEVTCGGKVYTQTFITPYFSEITNISIISNQGYEAGTLSVTGLNKVGDRYIVKGNNGVITASPAIRVRNVTIVPPNNGRIVCTYNNYEYDSSFTALNGSVITINAIPNQGYVVENVSVDDIFITNGQSYTVVNDITIESSIKVDGFNVFINQVSGATITATYNGQSYQNTFTVIRNGSVKIDVSVNEGYTLTSIKANGKVIQNGSTITISDDTTIVVEVTNLHTVTVVQPEHGRITIDGQYGTSFKVPHGKQIEVEATADEGYVVTDIIVE